MAQLITCHTSQVFLKAGKCLKLNSTMHKVTILTTFLIQMSKKLLDLKLVRWATFIITSVDKTCT